MASILGVETLQHTNGTTAATIASDGKVTFEKPTFSVAVIADEKAYNVDGGASSVGFNDRDLNTEVFDPDNIVSLSSNQFTLGAGTYIIDFSCPCYSGGQNQSQLYDVTNSTAVENGISTYGHSTYGGHTVSSGYARVSITANTTYKLRHFISDAKTVNGLGVKVGDSSLGNNVYSLVKITKLA